MVPARIWSSPSSRCASVAEALANRLNVPLALDARLQELDFGEWEGVAWADLPRAAMDLWASDPLAFGPPGGETGAQLIGRVAAFACRLSIEARRCIVVSHGGPLRLLPSLLRNDKPDLLAASPSLGSLSVLRIGG
jgi:alpha-ribazole phosphatase